MKGNNNGIAIFLTACISPNGMVFTKLQDAHVRKQQYIKALHYYLQNTDLPVVFCENTECDFSDHFRYYIQLGRLEYLTFRGNDYDKSRGKGYGEACIIKYALSHSSILQKSRFVLKITGRLLVENIQHIISTSFTSFHRLFRCSFTYNEFIQSHCFLVDTHSLSEIMQCNIETINDTQGFYFEHFMHTELVKRKDLLVIPFIFPLIVNGVSGTNGDPYPRHSFRENLFVNSLYAAILHSERSQYIRFLFWGTIYKMLKLF